tara:strand:+ start:369 stop:998 length:630 start_codon:yes stop_codon:yes gene_type:complete
MIIGLSGTIGCGKDTVADYLVNIHGFKREAFANSLKEAMSVIFGWEWALLEGRSKESRVWREQVDPWWAKRLNMPELTPRWVLQYVGTEVIRQNFADDMWIASLENRLRQRTDNVVITDVRFVNEIKMLKSLGAQCVEVKRGQQPDYYEIARLANAGDVNAQQKLVDMNVHKSETNWIGSEFDHVLDNNGSFDDLYANIDSALGLQVEA